MEVKYWSFAGLMITYWCSAACASCYLSCSPERDEQMSVDEALSFWRGLIEASPHGCRIHISGGEPFGDYERLISLCRRASSEGLGPLEKVETSAFWATGASVVRRRLGELDAAGMGKLVISCDPYHQQFVPIRRCRLAARVAEEVLGAPRVQVRWRDWLAEGFDTAELSDPERAKLFARYAAAGRDRLTGRAAAMLAPLLPGRRPDEFDHSPCREMLLRSRHVHVDPAGRVFPGVCAGIVLGVAREESIAEIWRRVSCDHAARPILSALSQRGPVGLLPLARKVGFAPRERYASKCHLCWEIRAHLASQGLDDELFHSQAPAKRDPPGRDDPPQSV